MSTQSQQIPTVPREALQLIVEQAQQALTDPWVRNYQSTGTMSQTGTSPGPEFSERMQRIGLGFTSVAAQLAQYSANVGRQAAQPRT